jgi:hypothetical protein
MNGAMLAQRPWRLGEKSFGLGSNRPLTAATRKRYRDAPFEQNISGKQHVLNHSTSVRLTATL